MKLFSRNVVLKKINNISITYKLPQSKTIADKKKEITYSINNKLLLMQRDWHKNRFIPKVNKVNMKQGNALPA